MVPTVGASSKQSAGPGLNIRRQQFVLSEVLRAVNLWHTRLSSTTALNWIKLGHLKALAKQSPGSGGRRLYSAINAVEMAALFHLTNIGLTLQDAAVCLPWFADRMKARVLNIDSTKKELAKYGELRLYVAYNIVKGEMMFRLLHDNEPGEEADQVRKSLRDVAAHVCINVDAIIDMTVAELLKIVIEQGTAEQQEGDEAREEAHQAWKIRLAEKYSVLSELQDKIKFEGREPNEAEAKEIGFLRFEINKLADNLKKLRQREERKS